MSTQQKITKHRPEGPTHETKQDRRLEQGYRERELAIGYEKRRLRAMGATERADAILDVLCLGGRRSAQEEATLAAIVELEMERRGMGRRAQP